MQGISSSFEKVLADFEKKLAKAEYVAIDTELTGVDIDGDIDSFEESADLRLERLCSVAERYTFIQLGLTLVCRQENGHREEGRLSCFSYNFFAFPYVSSDIKRDPVFMCQASALRFNAQHRVDFNAWIGQGVSYMTREDERHLKASNYTDQELEQKTGLLRLWKSLCAARLPFVVHSPLDLFFLLVAFERRPLPRGDPRLLALLIRQCTPKVYDTAHLFGAFGRFRRLGLSKFFEDAKARHEELMKNRSNSGVLPVVFELQGETAVRYKKPAEEMAHEAGYDSLMTAQLFGYLRAISPMRIREAANRLFLYRSIEFLDIDRAASEGTVGSSMFDLSRVTLLVAALEPSESTAIEAPRAIAAANAEFKWMDATHILVVLRASGGTAVRKAAELAAKVHGVESWMPFEQWRDERAPQLALSKALKAMPPPAPVSSPPVAATEAAPEAAPSAETLAPRSGSSPNPPSAGESTAVSVTTGGGPLDSERPSWTLFLRVLGVSGVLALLALMRLRRRLRPK